MTIIISILIYYVLVSWLGWRLSDKYKIWKLNRILKNDLKGVLKSKQIMYNMEGFIEVQNTVSKSLDKAIEKGIVKY
jgi:hypothetical protein